MQSLSFIIRAYNEQGLLQELVQSIREQDYPAELIELIVVDNGSTDGTGEIAKKLGAKVVNLSQAEFSYPKSLNVGCIEAKNDILVMVSAHCLFWKKDSLSKAVRHFDDKKVVGVYGPLIARPPYTFTQWLIGWVGYGKSLLEGVVQEKKVHLGILGNTNAMIRRSLWNEHHFNEEWGMGGEDLEWAQWALKDGYQIIKDPAFVVRHSHYLGFFASIKQHKFWLGVRSPRPFKRSELDFRPDIQHGPD